ncbi:MAG TPA: hypothetical protein VFB20_03155 [Burkholderiales bacterium]|nr:hypothetical protein [Burkholderiales bacterium]
MELVLGTGMRRILNVVGALYAAALLTAISAWAYVLWHNGKLDESAAAYVEGNLPAIVRPWNAAALERRLAPEMLTAYNRHAIEEYFSGLAALGAPKSLGKPAGRVGRGVYPGTTINGTWAEYDVDAQFDAGPAEIKLVLKRVDDGWQIASFYVATAAPARPAGEKAGGGTQRRIPKK